MMTGKLLDVVVPMLPFPNTMVAVIIAPLAIPIIEAVVLRLLRWGSVGRCLIDAVIVNVVTTIVGVLLVVTNRQAMTTVVALQAFALSVVIEGVLLWLIRRKPWREVWRDSIAMNTVSYVALFALSYVLGP